MIDHAAQAVALSSEPFYGSNSRRVHVPQQLARLHLTSHPYVVQHEHSLGVGHPGEKGFRVPFTSGLQVRCDAGRSKRHRGLALAAARRAVDERARRVANAMLLAQRRTLSVKVGARHAVRREVLQYRAIPPDG